MFACSLTPENTAWIQKKVSVHILLCVITLACAEHKTAVQNNWQLGFGRDLEPDRGFVSTLHISTSISTIRNDS